MVTNFPFRQTPHTWRNITLPPTRPTRNLPIYPMQDHYMGGKGQTLLNRLFGATPGQPLKIPIELPEISLSKETLNEMSEMLISSSLIIGGSLIVARVFQGLIKQ